MVYYVITFKNGQTLYLPNLTLQEIESITNLIGTNNGNNFITLKTDDKLLCGFIPNEIISLKAVNIEKEEK